jgi:branched-chain amino acid transport system permease protein
MNEAAVSDPARPLSAPPASLVHGYLVSAAIFLTLAAVPAMGFLGPEGFILPLVTRMMILALAAVALDFILGFGGLVSFGHAAFIGIGAYATGIMVTEGLTDALIILPVVLAVSALFALVTGFICLRTSGVYFIMITLAFGQMAFFAASSLSAYGGDDGLTLWDSATLFGTGWLSDDRGLFYVTLVVLVAGFLLVQMLVASRFGRVLRAARENDRRTASLGFDIFRIRLAAYVIAGMLAGIAGFLLACQAEFVSPAAMSWQHSGELIFMVVLGGMGTRNGALLGAIAFVALQHFLSDLTHDWKLIFGPLLVVIVLYSRGGLAALLGRITKGAVRV